MCNYRKSSLNWKSGQLFSLACHVVYTAMLSPITHHQPSARCKVEFVVCAKKGATKRFFKYAEKMYPSLSSTEQKVGRPVLINGPYAIIRPLRQFDGLVFLAGSTGATFTTPLMRDIVQQWMGVGLGKGSRSGLEPAAGAVTRYVKFV